MSESLQPAAERMTAAPVETIGAVAVQRSLDTGTFEPGLVQTGGDLDAVTLGHSGDGGDGSQKYHTPGNVHQLSEVTFD